MVGILLYALLNLAHAVDVPITTHWNAGFTANACIAITREMHTWRGHLRFDQPIHNIDIWVADAKKITDGHEYILTNKAWNADEHTGDTLCIEFLAHTSGDVVPRITFNLEGMTGSGAIGHHTTVAAGHNTHHTASAGHNSHHTAAVGHNQHTQSYHAPSVPTITNAGSARYNYAEAMAKSILFYDAQRSGKLPANNPIAWRGDSALGDRGEHGEDLTGGWYDAGDHVKFSLPMASSSTLLLWGYYRWNVTYSTAGQTAMFQDMIRWPLDYYLKCWNPQTETLYAQVGQGSLDHRFWGRAEDMTTRRPAYKLTPSNPGSDVAGEMAASLAIGSMVFKTSDASYSRQLLTAAKQIYHFGKKYQGKYSQSIHDASQFYKSSGFRDELCEGAIWLYRATGDHSYLQDAKGYHESAVPWALSWDDKKLACQLLLYEETHDSAYRQDVEGFFRSWLPGGSITYTPCGLAWRDHWGSNRYAANAAFVALMAADDGIQTEAYRQWAQGQINYILGDNKYGISYEIGFGKKYPLNPHHRSASCPDRPAPCSMANLHTPGPSPHLLVGALVGGPDSSDRYSDRRDDYTKNEVACDYNSGFQSALAGLADLVYHNQLPSIPAPACDSSPVNIDHVSLVGR